MQKYMVNSVNPIGTNIINNPAALKYFYIATIKKYLCSYNISEQGKLASCSLYLFLAKQELIEVPIY